MIVDRKARPPCAVTLRAQAARLRELAAATADGDARGELLYLAAEYDNAAQIESGQADNIAKTIFPT